MTLESPVPEAVKGWSEGMCREVGVVRKIEFPTQNICFRNFTFRASSYCYLREWKIAAGVGGGHLPRQIGTLSGFKAKVLGSNCHPSDMKIPRSPECSKSLALEASINVEYRDGEGRPAVLEESTLVTVWVQVSLPNE